MTSIHHSRYPLVLSLVFSFLLLCFSTMCSHTPEETEESGQAQFLKQPFDLEGEIIFHSNFDGDNEIYKISKKGVERLTDNCWNDEYPVWDPQKSKIAFTADPEGYYNIYSMTPSGTRIVQLTTAKTDDKDPAWFPDGQHIAYSQDTKKIINRDIKLFSVDITSKRSERILPDYGRTHALPHVSPSLQHIAFTGKRARGWDVAVYNTHTKAVKFLEEGGQSCRPRFSPDGQRLVYVSASADGKGDIWLMNPDGSDKVRLTERDQTYDYFPTWSPDGRFIAFNSSLQHDHNGDWQLYIIEIETGQTTLLFDSPGNDVFPDWR